MEPGKKVQWIYTSKNNTELARRYDQWAKDYDSDLNDAFGWIGPEKAAEIFARLVPKDARVLDAGAGTGLVGQALSGRGYSDVTAGDLSCGMLDEARKKNVYHECHQMVMGESLPFKTNSFDAVISVGALTLGHAPTSSFDELVRITRPGGHIVFGLRTDLYETGGFKEKQDALEKEKKWLLAETSLPFCPLPKGEPDILHRVWAYRILE